MAVFDEEPDVRELKPDLPRIAALDVFAVVVTAPGREVDFVSRFFAPRAGIPEDPVTGSAHCCLGPFWSARLGRSELTGYQASRRGGTVRVRVGETRTVLAGQAVTVVRGTLSSP
jgi:predicted PhzF superfamily epimerase YddE/YHI9